MNERIKLLAEQTKKYALDAMIKITDKEQALKVYSETYDTKFAELIVHQMLDITDAHTEVFQTDRDRALIEHIKQSVKQHFGVEE